MEIIKNALLANLKTNFNTNITNIQNINGVDLTGKIPSIKDFQGRRFYKNAKTPYLVLIAEDTNYQASTMTEYKKEFKFTLNICHQSNDILNLELIALRYIRAIEDFLRENVQIGNCMFNNINTIKPDFYEDNGQVFNLVVTAQFGYFRQE